MEGEKKSGGGVSGDASGGGVVGGGSRAAVNESSYDIQRNRRQFYIELKPGETTIVSWAKLLRESGAHVDQSPPPSPEPPKEYNHEEESRSECSDVVKKEKKEPNLGSSSTLHSPSKKRRGAVSEVLEENDGVQATKNTKLGHARVKATTGENFYGEKLPLLNASGMSSREKPSDIGTKSGSSPYGMTSNPDAICAELQSRTLMSQVSDEQSVNSGRMELPDLNLPYTLQAVNTSPIHIKDESGGILDGTMLDKTILELEKMVAESRRIHTDVQDADHAVATKSRLPRELKQKLEQVVRQAHSSQGGVSEELITRLMSILGNWLKLRTLKRYLREMVPNDLSASRWEDERFKQIRNEVIEMIKLRTPSLEAKDVPSNGMQELPAAHNAIDGMDHEMEDKICDFYDIYVQGMDEVKSPEIRKFYIQLAELWPKGTMDNHGIRNAICRAKERRRMLLQEKGHEKGKRKKSSARKADENLVREANSAAHPQAAPERPENDTSTPVLTVSDTVVPGTPELDQNLSAPVKRSSPPSMGSCKDLPKQAKFEILEDPSIKHINVSVIQLENNKEQS